MDTQAGPNTTARTRHRPASLWDLPPELFAPGLHHPHAAKYTFVIDRLWAHIEQGDGCWPWRGEKCPMGYGRLVIDPSRHTNGKRLKFRAHRCVYESIHGPVPNELIVCHRCNNRLCCNPAHLYVGTHRDNAHDRMVSGRDRRAKLTPDQVREVRARLATGHNIKRVARAFKVSHHTIRSIRRKESYRWVEELASAPEVAC